MRHRPKIKEQTMSLSLRPTISALLRNSTGALLVALQIAIALAVLVNAIYIVHQRIQKMGRPTGMDDANLFALTSVGFKEGVNYDASLREDLAYLRSLPGVVAATPADTVPLSLSGRVLDIWSQPDRKGLRAEINGFDMDEQALKTLGAHLLAGRDFRRDEILPPQRSDMTPEVILTRATAEKLFPGENALGRTVYDDLGKPGTIVGILDDMIGIGWDKLQSVVQVAIFPVRSPSDAVNYLVRTEPGRRDAIMRMAEEHLSGSNPNRVIKNVHSLEYYKKTLYLNDRAMEIFLITVTGLLVAVACLGIFALATFNVSARTKQIGTRRAVGGRRIDIVRYFLIENALITTVGVVAGCILALGVGYWLSLQYALPRLDLYYLVGGVLLLWAVSQLAAWQPARRAAAVPPSVATRTV
jgi:putative ABC transport system permease protein